MLSNDRLRHLPVRLVSLLALVLLVSSLTGCASMRAASAKNKHIDRATANHVYMKSVDAVFPSVRKMLFEQGFQVRDTSGTTLETEYLRDREYATRYLVTASPRGKGWAVHFTKDRIQRNSDRADVGRDLDMEWELLKRVDRARAAEIEREANAAGNAARASN